MIASELLSTFVQLRADGSATPVPWKPDRWKTLDLGEGDRILGAVHGEAETGFHPAMWEMHPNGDEVLYLLAGALDAIFDEPGGERVTKVHAGQTCLVPRGVWHRLVVREATDMMFVTPARGTQHRPV
ncbi:MAG: cupin domain-containing protein [Candidatus Rokubacteria bacterium]|nr:cupin domain-containing protein [Candidatus Rokubacteria bacterium]